ncbi:Alpha/Beta hydrolase protein [Obelidium mucronatum]|nr:Alpha/Beta hydrolase protein [Obelidium mucronatum]
MSFLFNPKFQITDTSIKAVTDAFSLAELFTYGTWHLADSKCSTDDDEFNGIVTLEDAKVLVQETQLQGKNVRVVESVDSFRVAVAQQSAILPDGLVSIGSDGKMSGDKAFLDRVSRDFSGKDMNGLMKDFENESLGVEAPARTSSHQNSKGKGRAFSFFRALIGSKADESETPQSPAIPDEKRDSALISPQKQPKQVRKRQSVVTMFDEQSTDGAYIEKFEYRVNNHQMKSSEQNSNTITRASDGHNYKQYPLPHLLRNFERYCRFSSAAYGAEFMKLMGVGNLRDIHTSDESIHANHFAFAIHAGIPVNDIILSSYTDYMLETGITQAKPVFDPVFHYVALDRFAKVVVVALRGTLALNDVLTDLKADYADFMGHRVHSGMLRSAVLMYRKGAAVREAVRQALEQNPGYGLVLTGHSLGGGVASLLALRWACPTPELGIPPTSPFHPPTPFVTSGRGGFPRGRPVHCFAYGSPCVVSLEFSVFAKGLVSTLVNGDDIVPTLSIGLVRDMKAVTMSLLDPKNRGLSERIIWRTLGFHNGSSPSSTTASNSNKTGSTGGDDDDYLLFVAGNAYWMVSSETGSHSLIKEV